MSGIPTDGVAGETLEPYIQYVEVGETGGMVAWLPSISQSSYTTGKLCCTK